MLEVKGRGQVLYTVSSREKVDASDGAMNRAVYNISTGEQGHTYTGVLANVDACLIRGWTARNNDLL